MQLIRNLFNAIFPTTCYSCGQFSDKSLCLKCLSEIKFLGPLVCEICGVPLSCEFKGNRCLACSLQKASGIFYDKVRGVCLYEGHIKKLISNFKYSRKDYLSQILSEIMISGIKEHSFLLLCELIVPVPLHWRKIFTRGFNQSDLLSKHLSLKTGIPLEKGNLKRRKHTDSQAKLTRTERLKNVENAFFVKNPVGFDSKKIMLIDDVSTTLETINQCAKTLKECGAAVVYGFTLARDV